MSYFKRLPVLSQTDNFYMQTFSLSMHRRLEKTQAIVNHILAHVSSPRRFPPGAEHTALKPLFVGISGPQGIGKTTITNHLVSTLSGAPHNLRVFAFSMDDLYLPFKDQEAIRQKYPDNKLIEFRGLPGTHDIHLGTDIFRALCEANKQALVGTKDLGSGHKNRRPENPNITVPIPTYDKSLYAGRGDQLPREQWHLAKAPFDVVLFEGWSLGFKSVRDSKQLAKIYQEHSTFPPHYLSQHSFSSLEMVNRSLEDYEREWYSFLDVFVHLSAPNLATIFKWRAEQEKDLWAKKGTGMMEEQVKEFVSRFMPAYEVYLERLKQENVFREDMRSREAVAIAGRHMRLDLDESRDLVSTSMVE
ncbi:hypothetical protein BGZ50_008576 [Haplosporangium sp. Z 11]|nr:hypothetical protein BGZ50_008576 [Haplosporangium sp. Z 11]